MKIERVEVRELALPLRYPFETSFGRTTRKEFLLVAGRGNSSILFHYELLST